MELNPVERIHRQELDVLLEPLAEQREQLVEQVRRRDDGGTGVEGEAVLPEDARSAARLVECFAERHAISQRSQPESGGDAAESRTDDDGVRAAARHRFASAAERRCASSSRQSRSESSRIARASSST
jgi:hypothetical protein